MLSQPTSATTTVGGGFPAGCRLGCLNTLSLLPLSVPSSLPDAGLVVSTNYRYYHYRCRLPCLMHVMLSQPTTATTTIGAVFPAGCRLGCLNRLPLLPQLDFASQFHYYPF